MHSENFWTTTSRQAVSVANFGNCLVVWWRKLYRTIRHSRAPSDEIGHIWSDGKNSQPLFLEDKVFPPILTKDPKYEIWGLNDCENVDCGLLGCDVLWSSRSYEITGCQTTKFQVLNLFWLMSYFHQAWWTIRACSVWEHACIDRNHDIRTAEIVQRWMWWGKMFVNDELEWMCEEEAVV
jgi:hypothetical protein